MLIHLIEKRKNCENVVLEVTVLDFNVLELVFSMFDCRNFA